MTSLSPIFSARTTNPDGRNGRKPTTVLMTRSGETSTGAKCLRAGAGGTIAATGRRDAHPAAMPLAEIVIARRKSLLVRTVDRMLLVYQPFWSTQRDFGAQWL